MGDQNTLLMLWESSSTFGTMTGSASKIQVPCLLGSWVECDKTLVVHRRLFCLMQLSLGLIWNLASDMDCRILWRVIKIGAHSSSMCLKLLILTSSNTLQKCFAVVFMFNYHHLSCSTPLVHITLMWITGIILHVHASLLKYVGQCCCLLC